MVGGFVVVSAAGKYWTGSAWSADCEQALAFRGPGDPYFDAAGLAEELCRNTGVGCSVWYMPCAKVAVGQVERLEPSR